ncbi:MAG: Zn-ribbon domain-containing OB-fold protein [Proteobacteria bacterium]|nr:Zn-ribbon domain-containing OB-fold protein [Pseudomonadota bacterium]
MTGRDAAFAGPGPDALFEEGLKAGRLRIQRCQRSGRCFFPPRLLSPYSGTPEVEWVEVSGRGTVYSTTVVRQRPERGGDYNIALVDLEEGGRMMTRVEGVPPAEVRIGMRVKARIASGPEGAPVVLFDPA